MMFVCVCVGGSVQVSYVRNIIHYLFANHPLVPIYIFKYFRLNVSQAHASLSFFLMNKTRSKIEEDKIFLGSKMIIKFLNEFHFAKK